MIAQVVADTKSDTLYCLIRRHIAEDSIIYTDGWGYGDISKHYSQKSVDHGSGFYGTTVIDMNTGAVTKVNTNSIENAWTHLKRMVIGTYYKISKRHLQSYVDEFVFRFNTRKHSITHRFNLMLKNMECRLTYKELVYGY